MEDSSRTFEIIYSAVNSAENSLSVSRMCEIAGVSRSGYYAWIKAEPSREKQELQDRKDFELILATAWVFKGGPWCLYEFAPYEPANSNESQKNPTSHGKIQSFLPNSES